MLLLQTNVDNDHRPFFGLSFLYKNLLLKSPVFYKLTKMPRLVQICNVNYIFCPWALKIFGLKNCYKDTWRTSTLTNYFADENTCLLNLALATLLKYNW